MCHLTLHKKWSFPLSISSVKFPADLVTFTEEILNGQLQFLCSVRSAIMKCAFHNFSTNFFNFTWNSSRIKQNSIISVSKLRSLSRNQCPLLSFMKDSFIKDKVLSEFFNTNRKPTAPLLWRYREILCLVGSFFTSLFKILKSFLKTFEKVFLKTFPVKH